MKDETMLKTTLEFLKKKEAEVTLRSEERGQVLCFEHEGWKGRIQHSEDILSAALLGKVTYDPDFARKLELFVFSAHHTFKFSVPQLVKFDSMYGVDCLFVMPVTREMTSDDVQNIFERVYADQRAGLEKLQEQLDRLSEFLGYERYVKVLRGQKGTENDDSNG